MTKAKKQPAKSASNRVKAEPAPNKPAHTNLLVGTSLGAVLLAVVISFAPLTPFLVTAPLAYVLLKKTKLSEHQLVTAVFVRWSLTVFFTALVASSFVTDRVAGSFPFAGGAAENVVSFLSGGSAGPTAGFLYITVGAAIFIVAGLLSAGILAYLVWAAALGVSAAAAAVLYTHGNNIVQITLIALPPWQIALFAAGMFAAAPVGAFSRRYVYKKNPAGADWGDLRRYVLAAAGLFVLSLLLKLTVSGGYTALVRHWTF